MKKISTLFDIEYTGQISHIKRAVRLENLWVFFDPANVKAMRKLDGSACLILDGNLYRRYDAKHGKAAPENAIPCQPEADPITGHHPHWIPIRVDDTDSRWHIDALGDIKLSDITNYYADGTYELIGEKVNSNREKITGHKLINHKSVFLNDLQPLTMDTGFDIIKEYLSTHDMEGIVFHHTDGRMCKIRKSDFNIKRG